MIRRMQKLLNEELHDLFFLPNNIRAIQSRVLGGRGLLHALEKDPFISEFGGRNL
jgi:hypothetical protein